MKVMKRLLLILLGVGTAQVNGAVETTFQQNNTLTHTTSNDSTSAIYGSSRNIYATNSSATVYSNDEISKAIDNLSAHAKQKKYKIGSLSSRLSYENKYSDAKDSLADMKKWANQGNVEYQVKVGLIYYNGEGVRQDLVLARKMFQKAAKQGNIQGQGMLGYFYEEGFGGLKRNRSTAKEWYGKTCDKGHQYGCDQYRRLNERGY